MTRHIMISLLVLAISTSATAQPEPVKGVKVERRASPAIPPASRAALERIARSLENASAETESNDQRNRALRELAAQEEMARVARWMFWLGLASLLLTLAGVMLVWRTLIHTRRAADAAHATVEEAKQSTVAAQEAVTIARENSLTQLRAYITMCSIKISGMDIAEAGDVEALVAFENSGQTPARNVRVSYGWRTGREEPGEEIFNFKPREGDRSTASVGAGYRHEFPHRINLTAAEKAAILAERAHLYLGGSIAYTDVFGREWRTTFRYYFRPKKAFDRLFYAKDGNDAT